MKIFISGISSGIGKALAIRLIKRGHEVWGLARRKELLHSLKEKIGSDNLHISVCDVQDIDTSKKIIQDMRANEFIPDIVVLCAGVRSEDAHPLSGLSFEKVQLMSRVNIEGGLFWVAEFMPDFMRRHSGIFIGISSTAAYRPSKNHVTYGATKAALSMAFRGLRLNYPSSGVRFSTIHFGPVATEMWEGKENFLTPSAEKAAIFIESVFKKKSGSYFFPAPTTMFMRLSLILPDSFFSLLAHLLKKD
ncbi:MAG: SDR family oxidoreductase [Candidatus Yanofskybacteria bacterium]|nr:SDR family oxidoreductase [Candidatus Yanofskybacteria bacterium]